MVVQYDSVAHIISVTHRTSAAFRLASARSQSANKWWSHLNRLLRALWADFWLRASSRLERNGLRSAASDFLATAGRLIGAKAQLDLPAQLIQQLKLSPQNMIDLHFTLSLSLAFLPYSRGRTM